MNEVFMLYDLKNLKGQLDHDLERLAQLEAQTTHITQTLTDMPGSPNRRLDKMDVQMARYLDYKAQVQKKAETYARARADLISAICRLPDQRDHSVLLMKYVFQMSNSDISASMGLKDRQAEYLIKKATKHFCNYFQS